MARSGQPFVRNRSAKASSCNDGGCLIRALSPDSVWRTAMADLMTALPLRCAVSSATASWGSGFSRYHRAGLRMLVPRIGSGNCEVRSPRIRLVKSEPVHVEEHAHRRRLQKAGASEEAPRPAVETARGIVVNLGIPRPTIKPAVADSATGLLRPHPAIANTPRTLFHSLGRWSIAAVDPG